ncbi:unnamed protein product [Rotaria sordida]|uniref:Uncharacterized protein n=1 Tax=Rotaria sordida TaxID=392033 RepID=A0A815I0J2_9BILA|nr:unnamed protein product [Rotaria sordida]CAF1361013.1 unnamed protein product [Rotaria sordida]
MFKRFRKRNYWKSVGNEDGYISAVEKLGPRYLELDAINGGYTEPDSIWGQLASFTEISEKNTYDTRKWLYTVWTDDRREVRTKFYRRKAADNLSEHKMSPSNNSTKKDAMSFDKTSSPGSKCVCGGCGIKDPYS